MTTNDETKTVNSVKRGQFCIGLAILCTAYHFPQTTKFLQGD